MARILSGGGDALRGAPGTARRPHQGLSAFSIEQSEGAVVVAADADLGPGPGAMGRHVDHVTSTASDIDHVPDFAVMVGDRVAALEHAPFRQRNRTNGELHLF